MFRGWRVTNVSTNLGGLNDHEENKCNFACSKLGRRKMLRGIDCTIKCKILICIPRLFRNKIMLKYKYRYQSVYGTRR